MKSRNVRNTAKAILAVFAILSCTHSKVASSAANECGQLSPPMVVRQSAEFYSTTSHYSKCSLAVKKLFQHRLQTGRYEVFPRKKSEIPRYAQVVRRYLSSCLFDAEDSLSQRLLGSDSVAQLRSSVGFFQLNGSTSEPFCHGILIGDKIVTARHCFGDLGGEVRVGSDVRFSRIVDKGSGMPVTIAKAIHPMPLRFDQYADDWLVLQGIQSQSTTPPRIKAASASSWESSILPLFDPTTILLSTGVASRSPDSAEVALAAPKKDRYPTRLLLDLSPICRVAHLQEGFLFHSCQSEVGNSGSPIISIARNGELKLVGIHSGKSSAIASSCNRDASLFFPNYGIPLPDQLLDFLNSQQ